ncbi:MAG: hypothetical protein LLG01_17405 [Planctomycetaceae bacterium]|nr:hypothetical protein [Planctomycetaceae bacterium]
MGIEGAVLFVGLVVALIAGASLGRKLAQKDNAREAMESMRVPIPASAAQELPHARPGWNKSLYLTLLASPVVLIVAVVLCYDYAHTAAAKQAIVVGTFLASIVSLVLSTAVIRNRKYDTCPNCQRHSSYDKRDVDLLMTCPHCGSNWQAGAGKVLVNREPVSRPVSHVPLPEVALTRPRSATAVAIWWIVVAAVMIFMGGMGLLFFIVSLMTVRASRELWGGCSVTGSILVTGLAVLVAAVFFLWGRRWAHVFLQVFSCLFIAGALAWLGYALATDGFRVPPTWFLPLMLTVVALTLLFIMNNRQIKSWVRTNQRPLR